jgi:hypothetical protein
MAVVFFVYSIYPIISIKLLYNLWYYNVYIINIFSFLFSIIVPLFIIPLILFFVSKKRKLKWIFYLFGINIVILILVHIPFLFKVLSFFDTYYFKYSPPVFLSYLWFIIIFINSILRIKRQKKNKTKITNNLEKKLELCNLEENIKSNNLEENNIKLKQPKNILYLRRIILIFFIIYFISFLLPCSRSCFMSSCWLLIGFMCTFFAMIAFPLTIVHFTNVYTIILVFKSKKWFENLTKINHYIFSWISILILIWLNFYELFSLKEDILFDNYIWIIFQILAYILIGTFLYMIILFFKTKKWFKYLIKNNRYILLSILIVILIVIWIIFIGKFELSRHNWFGFLFGHYVWSISQIIIYILVGILLNKIEK